MNQPNKVEELAYHSGVVAKRFIEQNRPRAYSKGKARYKEVERDIETFGKVYDQAEAEVGITASCKKGCNACCKHGVLVSQPDVDIILDYIDRHYDEPTRKIIHKKIRDAAEILDKEIGEAAKNIFEAKIKYFSREEESKQQYFELQLPCPLLGEEGQCMVYPVRPDACWSYRVYGDPLDCESSQNVPHGMIFLGLERYYVEKVKMTVSSGNMPKYESYHLAGFLPQKLRDGIAKK